MSLEHFQSVLVNEFSPDDSYKRYEYMRKLKALGLHFPSALLIYSHGNNIGNLSFLWRVPSQDESSYSKWMSEIEHVKLLLPSYKTRAMRITAFRKFGRITPGMSPANFRYMYKELIGDYSTSCNLDQSEIEKRVKLAIDMEDPDGILTVVISVCMIHFGLHVQNLFRRTLVNLFMIVDINK